MNNRYPQGYLPKIQYWAGRLQEAAYLGEPEKIPYIWEKLNYFMAKQNGLGEAAEIFPGTLSQLHNLSISK
jgi:hypothetical protein